jgi:hypothetical protein
VVKGDKRMSQILNKSILEIKPEDIPAVDMTYTDPPWGQGALTYYSNKAGMPTPDWHYFLEKLISLVKKTTGFVYIEMGNRWLDDLKFAIESQQGRILKTWEITYEIKRKATLLCATWNPKIQKAPPLNFTGFDDTVTPFMAVASSTKKGNLVFDPCIGLGTTARAALMYGLKIIGFEVNLDRFKILKQLVEDLEHEG